MTESIELCDTHCHLHDEGYPETTETMLANAAHDGVTKIVTLGSDYDNCQRALDCVNNYDGVSGVILRACLGFYPHDTGDFNDDTVRWLQQHIDDNRPKICGIGEVGLDYCNDTVGRDQQIVALEAQIQLAIDNNLPISFHARSGKYGDVFQDFWPILDNFSGRVRGVLHSYTDDMANLRKTLAHNLMVGVNGIVTFNKNEDLNEVYQAIPLERMVIETDAPFLSPVPYRGKVNQPCRIRQIAEYVASVRGLELAELAEITTANALQVYNL